MIQIILRSNYVTYNNIMRWFYVILIFFELLMLIWTQHSILEL